MSNRDFDIQYINVEPPPVSSSYFSVILQNDQKTKKKTYSIAKAFKPLLYLSSVFAMNSFIFSRKGLKPNNIIIKLYSLLLAAIFIALMAILRSKVWRKTKADLPLTSFSKALTVSISIEIIYDVFIVSFGNSGNYITLVEILENIDEHFGSSKQLFRKRRRLSAFLTIIPISLVGLTGAFDTFSIMKMEKYATLIIIMLQGVTIIYFFALIYGQIIFLNIILLSKVKRMSSSKRLILHCGVLQKTPFKLFRLMRHSAVNFVGDKILTINRHCWFELMQIYDRISDAVYIFNKIYAIQILFMYNTWLLCTMLAISRSLSPALKNMNPIRPEVYYFFFYHLRPLIVTKMSEYLTQEWQKMLLILNHILIHGDPNRDYYNQIETMIQLVESRKLQLSANLFQVTIKAYAAFAGQVISYSIFVIQNFYIHSILNDK